LNGSIEALGVRAQPIASHYINGEYCDDPEGKSFTSIDPAIGKPIAHLHEATPKITQSAINAASQAFVTWKEISGEQRGNILHRAAEILRERNEELSILETLDTGKAIQETRVADAASGADCLAYFSGVARSLSGESMTFPDSLIYTRREPLGVCVGIGAWNYPIQIACWKAAPALACGNTMIFKPSEMTPLSALKLAEILTEAGLPLGVFNVIQGSKDIVGAMIEHKNIAKVSLTGSVSTGKKVMAQTSSMLKHATMELGGKSPLIIFDDADIDDAVSGAMLGNFYSTGQICTNCTRVFVHKDIEKQFLERLVKRTKKILPFSRPTPDSLMPPKGISTGVRLYVLIQQIPASNLAATLWALARSRVNTPEANPNAVALARFITSSSSLKERTLITGPKISSWHILISSLTSLKITGAIKYPSSQPGTSGISPL
jgi:betaine-aldehyde dehydrogenase